jgi:hypothetical protein
MLHIFASVFSSTLQAFWRSVSSVSNVCCNKCFMWTSHMFHTNVASVLFRCCICFTHMLQVFYLDVAYVHTYVVTICFKCFICVRCMLHYIQVFHVASVSQGHGEWWAHSPNAGGRGVAELRTGGWGRSKLGAGSRVPPMRREEGARAKEWGAVGNMMHV